LFISVKEKGDKALEGGWVGKKTKVKNGGGEKYA
jgi:hypothetical protein